MSLFTQQLLLLGILQGLNEPKGRRTILHQTEFTNCGASKNESLDETSDKRSREQMKKRGARSETLQGDYFRPTSSLQRHYCFDFCCQQLRTRRWSLRSRDDLTEEYPSSVTRTIVIRPAHTEQITN